jgi:hypothetical protein
VRLAEEKITQEGQVSPLTRDRTSGGLGQDYTHPFIRGLSELGSSEYSSGLEPGFGRSSREESKGYELDPELVTGGYSLGERKKFHDPAGVTRTPPPTELPGSDGQDIGPVPGGGGGSLASYESMRDKMFGAQRDPFGDLGESIDELRGELDASGEDMATMAMIKAGLAIAGGTSPYAATNIGKGAAEGLDQFMEAKREGRRDRLAILGAEATIAQAEDASRRGYLNAEIQLQHNLATQAYRKAALNKPPADVLSFWGCR